MGTYIISARKCTDGKDWVCSEVDYLNNIGEDVEPSNPQSPPYHKYNTGLITLSNSAGLGYSWFKNGIGLDHSAALYFEVTGTPVETWENNGLTHYGFLQLHVVQQLT
jgi:hypothetical protein